MTVKELLDVVDAGRDSGVEIQVCSEQCWDTYETLNSSGSIIKSILDNRIRCMGAMGQDIIRIDIEWRKD